MTEAIKQEDIKAAQVNDDMTAQVNQVLDKIKPYIQADGGDLELVGVEDGVVTIRMSGACAGCALIDQTLNSGVKAWLLDEVPGIKDVILASPY